MNPTTTLTNNNPPATHECGLNPSPICREESETPQLGLRFQAATGSTRSGSVINMIPGEPLARPV